MQLAQALTFDEHRLVSLDEDRLVSVWEKLVTTLGIHTARVLLARAIWQTAQRHPEIALIHHDDAGLTFDALETIYASRPQREIEAAFSDLTAELLLILDRLLGRLSTRWVLVWPSCGIDRAAAQCAHKRGFSMPPGRCTARLDAICHLADARRCADVLRSLPWMR